MSPPVLFRTDSNTVRKRTFHSALFPGLNSGEVCVHALAPLDSYAILVPLFTPGDNARPG